MWARHAIAVLLLGACTRPSTPGLVTAPPTVETTAPARAPSEPAEASPIANPPAPMATLPTPAPSRPSTVDEPLPAYDRDAWPHWIDADGDCQDTRTEVLVAESIVPVTFTDAKKCEVASGQWRCPYTDRTFSDPRQLDVDHMVPLAEAHRSGGARWTKQQRTDYANDLSSPEHLVAVYKGANRSKGAHTIADWLPPEPGSRCAYVETWLRIKTRWKLRLDEREHAAADLDQQICAAGGVPERDTTVAKPREHERADAHPVTDTPRTCCRTCKKGKPCGDACIAADKACHAPPGCAC